MPWRDHQKYIKKKREIEYLKSNQRKTNKDFSPVLRHGSRGGIQAVLRVELEAAIDEGSAHADLRLQLG